MEETKTIYMCGVDWQYEFQDIPDKVVITDDVEHLKTLKKCWPRCGIVEVEVKFIKWIEEQNLDEN